MIRKAAPADLVAIVPAEDEAKGWLELIAVADLEKIIESNSIHVIEHEGRPVLAFGVGRIRLCAAEVPWVWGVIDGGIKSDCFSLVRRYAREAMRIIVSLAPGGYTSPEKSDPRYSRFLEFLGFRHLGWGLWQCPS